jgi:hypothetical protein
MKARLVKESLLNTDEMIHDLSDIIGLEEIDGGDLLKDSVAKELSEVMDNLKNAVKKWEMEDDSIPSAPNSQSFRASRSGTPISVQYNGWHRGGAYGWSGPFLVQIRIGGRLDLTIRQAIRKVSEMILEKYNFSCAWSKTRIDYTSGTNWSAVMMTAPRNDTHYQTIPYFKK